MPAMRAKLKLNHIDKRYEGQETLYFNPVAASKYPDDGSDENNTYAKFSPSGQFSLTVANPALLGKFTIGEEYYVDFTKGIPGLVGAVGPMGPAGPRGERGEADAAGPRGEPGPMATPATPVPQPRVRKPARRKICR